MKLRTLSWVAGLLFSCSMPFWLVVFVLLWGVVVARSQTVLIYETFDPMILGNGLGSYVDGAYVDGSGSVGVVPGVGVGGSAALQITGSFDSSTINWGDVGGIYAVPDMCGNTSANLSDYNLSFDAAVAGPNGVGGFTLFVQTWPGINYGGTQTGTLSTELRGVNNVINSGSWQHLSFNLGDLPVGSVDPTGATWQLLFEMDAERYGFVPLFDPVYGAALWIDNITITTTSGAQAQFHDETISISSSDSINNSEVVSFVPMLSGTATITYAFYLFPTAYGAEAAVAVSANNYYNPAIFWAALNNTPENTNWLGSELVVNGIISDAGMQADGGYTFGVCAGTTYYLSGSGTIYNPQSDDSPGTGDFGAAVSYPGSNYYTYSINNGTITITGYTGPGGAVAIPGAIDVGGGCVSDYLPVTSIGDYAFYGCSSLTSVSIPAIVASIGDSAFEDCTRLVNVKVGPNVTSIGDSAFEDCTRLVNVTIGPNVNSIGDYAFYDCTSLTSITIDKGDCSGLTSVTIATGVPGIGVEAFWNCTSLTNVTIPVRVTSVAEYAFEYCTSLPSINIPASVTSIGQQVFAYNYDLTNVCFEGNEPSDGGSIFENDPVSTIYYVNGTTGWGTTFDAVLTAPCAECGDSLPLIITWTNPPPIVYGTALSSSQLDATANLPSSFAYNPPAGTVLSAGTNTLTVIFTPTDTVDYTSAMDSVSIVVLAATPAVTWLPPSPIIYGTPLSSNQLNATANVPGTFAYTPTNGTVLNAGTNTLTVIFTPTDTVDYTSAMDTVTLTVTQATPIITWTNPAPIAYGAALGSSQLNATANVPGSFAYNPPGGSVLNVGTNTLCVIFTPTDTNDYNSVTDCVSVVVLLVCVPPPLGLVSWWPGEGNAVDIVSGNNGTLEGGVTFTNGEVGQAFDFDGSSGYVEVGDLADLDMSNSFSLECWIYPTGPGSGGGAGGTIISKEDEYEVARFSDGSIQWAFASSSPGWTWIDSGAITPLNQWSHVAVVYSNGLVNTYLNGVLANTYNGTGAIGNVGAPNDFRIGGRSWYSQFFQGLIDEVSIYDSALSANDILAIYSAGHAGKCMDALPPVIVEQPTNQITTEGSPVAFTVSAIGTAPLSYQWQDNGVNLVDNGRITGSQSNTLNISSALGGDAGNYTVVVTNAFGTATSQPAALFVFPLFPLTNWPASALGWYQVGYTNDGLYTIAPNGPGGPAFSVNCLMSLAGGGWTELTAEVADSILNTDPNTSRDYLYVQNGTVNYYRTPVSTLVWSWSSGQDLYGTYYYSTGSGEESFEVTPSSEHQAYGVGGSSGGGPTHKCLVIYSTCLDPINAQVQLCQDLTEIFGGACQCGVTVYFRENVYSVQIVPPVIVAPPTNQLVSQGSNAQFSVAAIGSQPLSYQWMFNSSNLTDNAQITGSQSNVLTLASVTMANAGTYQVIVTNAYGSVTSSVATLTVPIITWTNVVPGTAVIFVAGRTNFIPAPAGTPPANYILTRNNPPGPYAETLPISLAIVGGEVFEFSATGGVQYASTCNCAFYSSDGDRGNMISIDGLGGISGYDGPVGALLGVFWNDSDSSTAIAPATIDFTQPGATSATNFTPLLGQVFFIGDGLTGTGQGVPQTFVAPSGSTHLYFGYADAMNFSGPPGAYDDNTGSNVVLVSLITVIKETPGFSNLTASQSTTYSTTAITIAGTVSATGPIYPANGETVTVTINGDPQNTTVNDSTGDFSFSFNPSAIPASGTAYTITYSYAGNALLNPSTNTQTTLTVTQAIPMITWTNPVPITYGSALTSNQLNATANVPGSFAYNPTNGTVLNIGTNTLSVIFTPTDMEDYSSVTDTVSLVVSFVLWTPVPITYGMALGSNQLNATAYFPGSFAYTPTNGTVLNVGTNTLCVIFTPTDTNDYTSVTDCVSLVVSPAPLTVRAANASRQLGATNPVFTGTITGVTNGDNITATYSTTATINSSPGTYLIVPSLVDPNNRQTNYTVTLVNGTLTVTQAANYATPYTFTTLAGLALNAGSANGTNSTARFRYPEGVAVDANGNLYVADTDNDTIRKVTPAGVVTTLAGLAGSYGSANGTNSTARFDFPTGVAVDGAGNVYVADEYNHTIRKVTPVGTNWVVTTVAGLAGYTGSANGTNSTARFYYPEGVAVDANGNLYVADRNNDTIREVTPVGTNWVVTTLAGLARYTGSANGTNSVARFDFPTGVAVDSATNLYVADGYNYTIRKVTPVGTNWVVTTLAGQALSSGFNDGTGNAARFYYPEGLAVDANGNLYVADTDNDTIRKVTPVGTNWVVTTLAGLAGSYGSANGTGSAARFHFTAGVAVDGAGNVYVADEDNYTIRKGYYPFTAQFTASPTNGTVPLTVQFTSPSIDSQSNAITQWNWIFGDGSTSTLQSPSYIYTNAGAFQPSLIATNNLGFAVLGSGPSIAVNGNGYAAPFYYSVSNGAITITGYNGSGGTVTIPSAINGLAVTSIGTNAFYECFSLTNVTIGTNITSIEDYAFYDCGLTSVTIPNSVTNIGSFVFEWCFWLTNVTIGNSVTSIGVQAFWNCGLASVTIPASVTNIGLVAFGGCFGLTAITVNPSNPAYISVNGVLFNKTQTTLIQCPGGKFGSYSVPNSVTSIGGMAFAACESLTSVTIPDTVTNIGIGAFALCTSLTSVTIPGSVTSIGPEAFISCGSLTSVYFEGNAPTVDSATFVGASQVTVYYLPGTTDWGGFSANTGVRTAFWFLPFPVILTIVNTSFGVQNNTFGFIISWATDASVVVEACTNLSNPIWIPLQTNTLTNGSFYFSEPLQTNGSGRYYRITSP